MNQPVDWSRVSSVLLDMDGTLLDLHFDNTFWLERVPRAWGDARGIDFAKACETLFPRMNALRGTLDWYSVEFWSRELDLDIIAMKREARAQIRVREGVHEFLDAVRDSGRDLYLLTNAHPRTLDIKLGHTGIGHYFDVILSSFELGAPKENRAFWRALVERHPVDPKLSLFVDDSIPVLVAAREFGIGAVLAVRQPDSAGPAADRPGFVGLDDFSRLMPIPARWP